MNVIARNVFGCFSTTVTERNKKIVVRCWDSRSCKNNKTQADKMNKTAVFPDTLLGNMEEKRRNHVDLVLADEAKKKKLMWARVWSDLFWLEKRISSSMTHTDLLDREAREEKALDRFLNKLRPIIENATGMKSWVNKRWSKLPVLSVRPKVIRV